MTRSRSRRMHAVHEHQLPLALVWAPEEIAARAHLRVLPGGIHEPEPLAPAAIAAVATRRAA